MLNTKIRNLRKARGMTQAELAQRLNVTQQAVGLWETGKNTPDLPMLKSIANLFSVTTDYLVGNAENAAQISSFTASDNLLDVILKASPKLRKKVLGLKITKDGEIIDADAVYQLTDAQKLALCQFLEMALEAAGREGKS